ncbi:E3 ubiquitin-protein ligase UPL4-like isoform X1 [Zingiber officinale]|uniref:E3 ubiquitin-protein ligase UPL4-like isoform X1 n=2 Tax=Zingiber officinale TaxID=94328 RepID=UPI001C4B81D7|nr:E3 ubiquitin-protein ligase UPL4-like isoform X1 [Zingiber officinale]
MDRGRKREGAADLRADKRACSSSDHRPCSSASGSPPPQPPHSEMESSSSGRSDRGGDSGYGSCDSDDYAGGYDSRSVRGRLHRVLVGLADDGSGGSEQLAALTELCEVLSFCMEDAMGYFPVESVVPPLVKLAGHESNPEVMLLAIRALTYLCDSMPRSADAIVRHGALPVLCGRLLAIEYLDVAEQCHQALEKISRKQPIACLQAGTANAVLTYIDFFPSSIQRAAVSTIANMCKKLPPDCSSSIIESVPTLCALLQNEDTKLVETVAICLARIADSIGSSSNLLDELCKLGLIQKSLELITNDGHRTLSRVTYSGLIALLTKLAGNSQLAVQTLFELNISRTLRNVLLGSDMSDDSAYASTEDLQINQVYEVLKLANQLIPPRERDPDNQLTEAKEKIQMVVPNFLDQFATEILPASIKVVNSDANPYVCYGCVSIISRIAYYSAPDTLLKSIKDINISYFLAGLLLKKDPHILLSTLETVEILMQKLPGFFLSSFIKEGVVHAIDALLSEDKCTEPVLGHSDDQMVVKDISRCLCYSFALSRVPSSEAKTCKIVKESIHNLGRHIKATYFANGAMSSDMGFTETLQNLKTLCKVLTESVDIHLNSDNSLQDEENLTQMLDQVMRAFSQEDPMSTFEFVESGLARSLIHYLSNGKYPLGTHSVGLSSHILTILKRFQTFAFICLSKPCQSCDNTILVILLKKLQNALSSLDNFPVIVSQGYKARNTYADIPARCCTMNPCLRVRFVREKAESHLSDYNNVLNVDISSSVDDIEGYLWPKVSENKNVNLTESMDNNISKLKLTSSRSNHTSEGDSIETHTNISNETCISNSSEVIRSQEQLLPTETSPLQSTSGVKSGPEITITASPSIGEAKQKLTFSLSGKQLDRSKTLYQAVLEDQMSSESHMVVGSRFWNQLYKLTYRVAEDENSSKGQLLDCVSQSNILLNKLGFSWQKLPFFPTIFQIEMPSNFDKMSSTYDILFMLKILEGLNHFSLELLTDERVGAFAEGKIDNLDDLKVIIPSVPELGFVNSKLSDKLEQQLRDPLVLTTGYFPSWCSQLMNSCSFLFSFEARWKYFYLTAFGSLKNQQNSIQHSNSPGTNSSSDSLTFPRKKFKVDRNKILECAMKMMELHVHSKGSLEVEYDEEVGTGLGPTMEFYTLLSHEFQKAGLGMWREDLCHSVGESGLLSAPFGLFPRPWSTTTGVLGGTEFSDVIKKFLLLGKLVAKTIKDGRILDIPFSRGFYKIMLEQVLSICDIQSFDSELGRTLLEFQAVINRKMFVESVPGKSHGVPSNLNYRGISVKDLSLDFTLPGYSDYALSSESTKLVNIDNLEEYVALVVDATIGSGIERQVDAFKSGFNEVFPLKALKIFNEDELERLLCGEQDTWDFTELVDHIKFDHGYTMSSPTVINLLEIIQEFGCDQRRAFLQFVTGAPRLAHGGLAALNPKLTVVRKHGSCDADLDLPSVMTCANYLKLPPYSSKEKMREKLMYAITEGQGSFHLS